MKVIVIGCGPCGMMSAITFKKFHPDDEVLILEKNDKIGQRIRISGNGRCNFSNTNFSPLKYNHPEFIDNFDKELVLLNSYYKETGFYYFHDEEGRMYPESESSLSYLYIMNKLMNKYHVRYKLETKVLSIKKVDNHYQISTDKEDYSCDKIVLSIGGVSLNNQEENYLRIMKFVSPELVPFEASLTPIVTSSFNKKMEGKRVKANVKLLYKGKVLKEEKGEVLFKKNGVSGIVIFNMSSYLARLHLSSYENYEFSFDMLNDLSLKEMNEFLKYDPTYNTLLQEDIADEIYLNKMNPKDYRLKIVSLYGLKDSQVTSGGVSIQELNFNFSLKKDDNVFIGGEAIDIDGECGGYNIEFALLSGIRIGENL